MKKRKGRLLGRYVPPHIRRAPYRPREYVNVSDWQENERPIPSQAVQAPLQGELELVGSHGNDDSAP